MSRLFRDLGGQRLSSRGSVVCISAFDGLHLGHRALLQRVRDRAAAIGADAAVVSFEPLPREYFAPDGEEPPRLLWPRAKLCLLDEAGMDLIGLLRFGATLAALPAEDFVRHVLVGRLAAREVWVGEDFRFGHRRAGDLALLQRLGAELGFEAQAVPVVDKDGERISSSRIRILLRAGELDRAARLLGRPYALGGRVLHGRQLGRKLGYPTANLGLKGRRPALDGIFAARVRGVGALAWPAVASLGTRPTVNGREPLLEAHLFDFDGDLYGRQIEVEFVARLREERRFDGLDALVAQMDKDAAAARAVLAAGTNRRGAIA
jgi:riboflavin kinase/FMN adenylyltransferase